MPVVCSREELPLASGMAAARVPPCATGPDEGIVRARGPWAWASAALRSAAPSSMNEKGFDRSHRLKPVRPSTAPLRSGAKCKPLSIATCPLIAGTHLSLLLGHQAFSGDWIWKRRRGGAPAQIAPRWTPYLGPPLCSRCVPVSRDWRRGVANSHVVTKACRGVVKSPAQISRPELKPFRTGTAPLCVGRDGCPCLQSSYSDTRTCTRPLCARRVGWPCAQSSY